MTNPFVDQETEEEPTSGDIVTEDPRSEDRILNEALDHDEIEISTEPAEEQLTRKEKKANRYKENERRADRAELKAEMLEKQLEQQRAAPAPQYIPQAPATPPEDPYQKKLDDIFERKMQVSETYQAKLQAGNLSAEELKRLTDESRKLDEQQGEIIAQRTIQRSGIGKPDAQAEQRTFMQAKYGDVLNHPQARQYAMGKFQMAMSKGASNTDYAVFDEIYEDTKKEFKIGKFRNGSAPSEGTRNRHHGVSAGASGTPGNETKKVRMGHAQRQMAVGLYPNLEPAQAYRKWAQEVGKYE